MTTTSDFLSLVRNDLRNVEVYAGDIKLGIDGNELSMEDARYRVRNLKAYVESLYQGVEEYISDPHGLAEEEQK